jgi:hypothetical protein
MPIFSAVLMCKRDRTIDGVKVPHQIRQTTWDAVMTAKFTDVALMPRLTTRGCGSRPGGADEALRHACTLHQYGRPRDSCASQFMRIDRT